MRKIYVASSWRNTLQPHVVKFLESRGHEVYDFRNPSMGPGARGKGFHWSAIDPHWKKWSPREFREALKHPIAQDGYRSDMTGLDWCDTCVLVMPCGRSAHLELGYACGAGKRTIALLDGESEPELMYGMVDHLCVNLDEVQLALLGGSSR